MKTIDIAKQINRDVDWQKPEYQFTEKRFLWFFKYWQPPAKERDYDSRQRLNSMGFTVIGETHWHYVCEIPDDLVVIKQGYWTDIYQGDRKIIAQFDKWASYDSCHQVDFLIESE